MTLRPARFVKLEGYDRILTSPPLEFAVNRLPHIAVLISAVLLLAVDKKPEPSPSAAQIQQWVKQLGDESFKVREEATRDLIKAGGAAFDAVTKATKSEDAEVKQRALMIIEPIRKQFKKAAIAYFKELGGEVTVDEKSPGMPVIGLGLSVTKVTDAGLMHLKGFTSLRTLWLNNTKITDVGLVHLKGLTNLQRLSLSHTNVTDAGLVHLKGLTSLQELDLWRIKVTGDGLMHLACAID